jgi:hypothetical protein
MVEERGEPFLLPLPSCRMRSSACDTLSRSCARRVLCWRQVLRPRRAFGPCHSAPETCCLPRSKQRRHPGIGFRGSMAGLCPPLPTLRRRPYGRQRMARGRCGSLLLHRNGLAPPTPCRSPGALRVSHGQPGSPVAVGRVRFAKMRDTPKYEPMSTPRR